MLSQHPFFFFPLVFCNEILTIYFAIFTQSILTYSSGQLKLCSLHYKSVKDKYYTFIKGKIYCKTATFMK